MILARSALPGFAIAIAVLIAGLVLALTVGRYPVSLGDLIGVLVSKLGGPRGDVSPAVESVIWQVRGPLHLTEGRGAGLAIEGDTENIDFVFLESSYNGRTASRAYRSSPASCTRSRPVPHQTLR